MSQTNKNGSGPQVGIIGGVLGGLALVFCCAAPALIAGGTLSAIGGVLSNPLVIALGVALIVSASLVTRRRRTTGDQACDSKPLVTEFHDD